MTPDALATADERTMLDGFLDHFRHVVVRKVEGVADDDAARAGVPSGTSLLWLVQHLADVEHWWFTQVFAGRRGGLPPAPPTEPLAAAVARYQEACEASRQAAAGAALDDVAAHPRHHFSLRWILLHMIEETSRHAGHADILRELIDGTSGD